MTVLEIVKKYLEENQFDGLYDALECACKRDDIAPCGSIGHDCMPGYLTPCDCADEHDWHIGPKKEPRP